jgi:hypothetical protein
VNHTRVNTVPVGTLLVLPGSVIHESPPCQAEEIQVHFFGCMAVHGSDAVEVVRLPKKIRQPQPVCRKKAAQ